MIYHRLWLVALPFMITDVLYYGPQTAGGPAAAIIAASMFLWVITSWISKEKKLFKLKYDLSFILKVLINQNYN